MLQLVGQLRCWTVGAAGGCGGSEVKGQQPVQGPDPQTAAVAAVGLRLTVNIN